MSKRKHANAEARPGSDRMDVDGDDASDSSAGEDEIVSALADHFLNHNTDDITVDELFNEQVDVELFDPQEQDFHGIKLLLRQLFNVDSDLFDLSALADLILSQPTIGSTIKMTPEQDTPTNLEDPVSILTVLNLNEHRARREIQSLTSYIIAKAARTPAMAPLKQLLSQESKAQVGLVFSDRFGVQLPIIPETYRMLLEEIEWAVADREPYAFSHYLILSRMETKVASKLDGTIIRESARSRVPSKKSKLAKPRNGGSSADAIALEHEELEVFRAQASASMDFQYTSEAAEGASDAKRTLTDQGSTYCGHLMLLEADAFVAAVKAMPAHFEALTREQTERDRRARQKFDRLVSKGQLEQAAKKLPQKKG